MTRPASAHNPPSGSPPRSDFQHRVVRTKRRQRHDFADDVRVDEKILTKPFQGWRKGRGHGSGGFHPAVRSCRPQAFRQRDKIGPIIFHFVAELLDQIVGERHACSFSRQTIRFGLSRMLLEQGHRANFPLSHAFSAQVVLKSRMVLVAIASNLPPADR